MFNQTQILEIYSRERQAHAQPVATHDTIKPLGVESATHNWSVTTICILCTAFRYDSDCTRVGMSIVRSLETRAIMRLLQYSFCAQVCVCPSGTLAILAC
jgi:hypothetical protein